MVASAGIHVPLLMRDGRVDVIRTRPSRKARPARIAPPFRQLHFEFAICCERSGNVRGATRVIAQDVGATIGTRGSESGRFGFPDLLFRGKPRYLVAVPGTFTARLGVGTHP